ncbi:hypothetical protein [Rhizobium ruizarguesonis]|uniref:hypothetical protein n=1 Tax=Rhizobium ruizarguesonis TaxID=2081791 RepID=UPI001031BC06|nr:hypothetical protein [Rhizobium ruizarguesonis]TAT70060.1 hypothetical protein ELI52_38200 [Rhizobium ruizarguesonis]
MRLAIVSLAVATCLNSVPVNAETDDDAVGLLKAALNCDVAVGQKESEGKKIYEKFLASKYIGETDKFSLSLRYTEFLLKRKALSNVHWVSQKFAFNAIASVEKRDASVFITCLAGAKCIHVETRTSYGPSYKRKLDCSISEFCSDDMKPGDTADDASEASFQVCSPDAAQDAVDAIDYLAHSERTESNQ